MALRYLTQDKRKETKAERANFERSIKVERDFARQLRSVAAKVGSIIDGFDPNDYDDMRAAELLLTEYSKLIKPWATAVSRRMLTDVSRRDEKQWQKVSKSMGAEIRREIHRTNPTGRLLRSLLDEQVALIQSIPLDAAKRVHKYTLEGLESGERAADIAEKIRRGGHVSKSRAMLIARTEVARTSSLLTESRAKQIGSEGYIWRTSRDEDVRRSHKKMEGKFVRWDDPPTLSDGTTTHAGQIYNCRCWPEPVIPDDI